MLTEKQKSCYEKLFEITEKNMLESGNEMILEKDAFLSCVESPVADTDVARLSSMSRMAFLQSMYTQTLYAFIDEWLFDIARKREKQTDYDFKRGVIEDIKNNPDFRYNQGFIRNNIYNRDDSKQSLIVDFAEYRFLYGIYSNYKKLPQGFRRGVRRLFGRRE